MPFGLRRERRLSSLRGRNAKRNRVRQSRWSLCDLAAGSEIALVFSQAPSQWGTWFKVLHAAAAAHFISRFCCQAAQPRCEASRPVTFKVSNRRSRHLFPVHFSPSHFLSFPLSHSTLPTYHPIFLLRIPNFFSIASFSLHPGLLFLERLCSPLHISASLSRTSTRRRTGTQQPASTEGADPWSLNVPSNLISDPLPSILPQAAKQDDFQGAPPPVHVMTMSLCVA